MIEVLHLHTKKEIFMGNNTAYSTFQHTVITIYDHNKLDLELLDELAKEYAHTDIDSGGDTGLLSKDGKTLEEICIEIVEPGWIPVKNEDESVYYNPIDWEFDERYNMWQSITNDRWKWS